MQEISFSENCLEKTSLLGGGGSSIVTKDLLFGNVKIFFIYSNYHEFNQKRLRKTVKQVNNNKTSDNTEEITKKVKEILLGKSFLDRRLIKAFPKITLYYSLSLHNQFIFFYFYCYSLVLIYIEKNNHCFVTLPF